MISAKSVELPYTFICSMPLWAGEKDFKIQDIHIGNHLFRKCYIYEENQQLNIYFGEHHKKCIIFLLLYGWNTNSYERGNL